MKQNNYPIETKITTRTNITKNTSRQKKQKKTNRTKSNQNYINEDKTTGENNKTDSTDG